MIMGLTKSPEERPNNDNPASHLSGTPFATVIHDILNSLFMLFENTSQIRRCYGCEKLKPNQNQAEVPCAASAIPEPSHVSTPTPGQPSQVPSATPPPAPPSPPSPRWPLE